VKSQSTYVKENECGSTILQTLKVQSVFTRK